MAEAKKGEKAGKEQARGKSLAAERPRDAVGKKQEKMPFEMKMLGFLQRHSLLVAGIACIAIIGAAFIYVSMPEEADVEDFWNANQEMSTVKMIVVTSNRCPGCEAGNSLEILFQANGVEYGVEFVEESSAEGQGLIQATGIRKLPAFIIEEESISDSVLVKTKSGFAPLKDVLHSYVNKGKGTYWEGIFVFSEMMLDEGKIRPNILLEETCGDKHNILVQYFADPYDPRTIERSLDFENLRTLLEAEPDINVEFEYVYLPTYSRFLEEVYLSEFGGNPKFVRDNIEGVAKHLVCVDREFGTKKFNRLQEAIYSTYCEIDENTMASGAIQPLFDCGDSNHYGFFVNGEELEDAVKKAMIYEGVQLSECLYTVENKFEIMELLAEKAGIDRTPTALVNCQYEVPLDKVLAAVCQINNGLPLCWE